MPRSGFTSVWVNTCFVKCRFRANCLPQYLHETSCVPIKLCLRGSPSGILKFVKPFLLILCLCLSMCLLRLSKEHMAIPQYIQLNGVRTFILISCLENYFPQNPYAQTIMPPGCSASLQGMNPKSERRKYKNLWDNDNHIQNELFGSYFY